MRIILLGNYPPDGQESMERFAQMMQQGLHQAAVQTELWRPIPVFGAGAGSTTSGFRKWLGYLDKWIVFPLVIRWRLRQQKLQQSDVYFHICDHSNAPYLAHLPAARAGITCHDVLAIRGGLGHSDAYVPASRFGRILQQWIFGRLRRAQRLAAVSQLTLDQLLELDGRAVAQKPAKWQVIHNAFNAPFTALPPAEATPLVHQAGIPDGQPFLLHVGSGLARKNRGLLLKMAHALGTRWSGLICFAGEAPDEALLSQAAALGLSQRVVAVARPDHQTLVALYSACAAFIFPSYSEGFGWPVIEAQACGAPIIASNIAPMPEVSGGAALHASPDDAVAFAEAFLTLQDPATRHDLVQRGFANCARFEPAHMTDAYLRLYDLA
ncbi:glycosyltransferase family 4 protein [Hymenobacter aerilatus]|uniref:Glycosyltransferase family 4 protein n=1 Tax=Hymenobacter aerilatus TaxID=2932251 RepID=A0A8T9SQW6_9BACT|nr:glycosyltransferase family 1 protein [Hymenobacter aerilatus]UOR04482.1 glycosyltransferase family 4 protein [Hymenobacter aerilatus]